MEEKDDFWPRMLAVALCATVAIGLYRATPRIWDRLKAKNSTQETVSRMSAGALAKADSPSESMNISIPNSVVLVGVRDTPLATQNKYIGSGVLVSKVVAGKKRLMLLTARHVASIAVGLRGKVELGLMAPGGGVERKSVENGMWLIDGEKDDDLAILDLTDEMEHSAIDLDNGSPIKFVTSDKFGAIDIKNGSRAFGVCGSPGEDNFIVRTGWYLDKLPAEIMNSELYAFLMDAIPGNSGSPMFVVENDVIYLVGIFSRGMKEENRSYAGVVPLDSLLKLLSDKGAPYFDSAEARKRHLPDMERIVKLLNAKGIDKCNPAPCQNVPVLPSSVTLDGVTYRIERNTEQDVLFKVLDQSGKAISYARYDSFPTEMDLLVAAFSRADTDRSLSVEEAGSRISCNRLDDERGILHVVGVNGTNFLLCKNVLVTFPNRDAGRIDLFMKILEIMAN